VSKVGVLISGRTRRPQVLLGPRLDGHLTFFNGPAYWSVVAAAAGLALVLPSFSSIFLVSNLTSFYLNLPLALGLALLWGYGGILSFGQMAFFSIAGYAYAVLAVNLGGGTWTLLAAVFAVVLGMMVAAAFGYFVFFGRVSGLIVPVLTFVLTLILETFLGQTARPEWKIGRALLGGYNGMTNIPSLEVAGMTFDGFTTPLYYLVVLSSFAIFLGMRVAANRRLGHILTAIQIDDERCELLGYDVRIYQLMVFVFAAGAASLSGVFYVSWGNYITPANAGMLPVTLPVLWVAVGGRTSFTAVVLSTIGLQFASNWLAAFGGQYSLISMGALLLLTMMFAPEGLVIGLIGSLRDRVS
jgi:ABC-type branched-subunit amino acid transport system permease subunit